MSHQTRFVQHASGKPRLHDEAAGDLVRKLRQETLLTSSAAWRALLVALHDAKDKGVDAETAIDRVRHASSLSWTRDSKFFYGSLLDLDPNTGKPTGKLLSSRESIDTATDKLVKVMTTA